MNGLLFSKWLAASIVQSGGDYSVLTPAEIEDLEIYVLGKKTN